MLTKPLIQPSSLCGSTTHLNVKLSKVKYLIYELCNLTVSQQWCLLIVFLLLKVWRLLVCWGENVTRQMLREARTSPSDAPTLKLTKTSTDLQLVSQLWLERRMNKQRGRSCSISSIFSDSSLQTDMPDIFDAWQSASSCWGCDQHLTSKHASPLTEPEVNLRRKG